MTQPNPTPPVPPLYNARGRLLQVAAHDLGPLADFIRDVIHSGPHMARYNGEDVVCTLLYSIALLRAEASILKGILVDAGAIEPEEYDRLLAEAGEATAVEDAKWIEENANGDYNLAFAFKPVAPPAENTSAIDSPAVRGQD